MQIRATWCEKEANAKLNTSVQVYKTSVQSQGRSTVNNNMFFFPTRKMPKFALKMEFCHLFFLDFWFSQNAFAKNPRLSCVCPMFTWGSSLFYGALEENQQYLINSKWCICVTSPSSVYLSSFFALSYWLSNTFFFFRSKCNLRPRELLGAPGDCPRKIFNFRWPKPHQVLHKNRPKRLTCVLIDELASLDAKTFRVKSTEVIKNSLA